MRFQVGPWFCWFLVFSFSPQQRVGQWHLYPIPVWTGHKMGTWITPRGLDYLGIISHGYSTEGPAGRDWNMSLALCKERMGMKQTPHETPVWVNVILNSAQLSLTQRKDGKHLNESPTRLKHGWMRCWNTARVVFSLGKPFALILQPSKMPSADANSPLFNQAGYSQVTTCILLWGGSLVLET